MELGKGTKEKLGGGKGGKVLTTMRVDDIFNNHRQLKSYPDKGIRLIPLFLPRRKESPWQSRLGSMASGESAGAFFGLPCRGKNSPTSRSSPSTT
jgi:hypothetical protein